MSPLSTEDCHRLQMKTNCVTTNKTDEYDVIVWGGMQML